MSFLTRRGISSRTRWLGVEGGGGTMNVERMNDERGRMGVGDWVQGGTGVFLGGAG